MSSSLYQHSNESHHHFFSIFLLVSQTFYLFLAQKSEINFYYSKLTKMKRLLLVLCALLTLGGSGAWAQAITVTLVDGTNAPYDTYGTRNNSATPNTVTTNVASGLAGVVLSAPVIDRATWWNTYCLALCPSATQTAETVTFTAPEGYLLLSVNMTAQANSSTYPYDVVFNGSTTNVTGASAKTFSANNILAPSFSFTINHTAASFHATNKWLAVKSLTLQLVKIVTNTSQINANKSYVVKCDRSAWAVANNGTSLSTIGELNLALSIPDAKQRFAFVTPNGTDYYLYSVKAGKFLHAENNAGNGGSWVEGPSADKVFFADGSSYKANTWRVYLEGTNKNINVGGSNQVTIDSWATADAGCAYYLIEAADVDGAALVERLKGPVSVTWNVVSEANGSAVATGTSGAYRTESLALPSELARPFCTYEYFTDAACTQAITSFASDYEGTTGTIYAKYTTALPFEVSTSYADATWYYATIRGSKYLRADDSAKDGSDRYSTNATNEKTDAYKWAFFGDPYSNYYIANMAQGDGKYLYNSTGNNKGPVFQTVADPSSDNRAQWAISVNGDGFTVRSVGGGANYYINDAGNVGNLGYWNSAAGATDAGGRWDVEAVPAGEVDITFNVVLDGNIIATANDRQAVGGAPVIPGALARDYTDYTFDVAEITPSTTTITATPVFTGLPFTVSTDYASATWYYMHGHATYNDRYISTSGDATVWGVGNGETDAYKWAFIGNPIEGFKVINKAAGAGKYLQGNNPADMGATAKTWVLKKQLVNNSTNTAFKNTEADNAFGLYDESLKYINTQGTTLKYWSSFDQGSTFWLTLAPTDAEVYDALIAELESYTFGTAIGQYSVNVESTDYTSQATTIIAGLKSAGYTAENLTQAQAFAAGVSLNTPAAGFYRLKNVATGKYLTATALASGYTDTNKYVFANGNSTDASTVIRLYDKDSDGHLYMYNQGAGFGWVATTTGGKVGWITTAPDKYVNWFAGNAAGQIAFALCYGNGTGEYAAYLTQGIYTADANEAVIAGTDYTADAAQWVVEEATTVNVSLNNGGDGNYYATLCLPFTVTLDGCNAYTLTLNSAKTGLTLSEPMTEVPAGTPVFLKGTSASATANIAADAAYGAPLTTTALTGTYTDLTVNGATDYFLGKADDAVGFYHWDGSTLKANRAYMEGSKMEGSIKGFAIDFDYADAIHNLFENSEDNDIYDLSGRRVSQPKQGLYIVNGKKMLVK